MTDLDELLRATLHERAATVNDAPGMQGGALPRERSRWLPVAATVAAVLVAGGGAAMWGLSGKHTDQHSGGGYARTCTTTLPAAWKSAFSAPALMTRGKSDSVSEVTPYGDVVEQTTDVGGTLIGLRVADGSIAALYEIPPETDLLGTSTDGADLVLSLTDDDPQRPGTTVDELVAVNVRTAVVRHVLRTADTPSGTVVADKAAVVRDGIVYWVTIPRGTEEDAETGTVLAYHLSDGRTHVVGHSARLLSGPDDPRGVYWTGGGVPAAHVPPSVPAVREVGYDPAVSDGTNFAWLRSADPHLVGWADAGGDERRWTVEIPGRSSVRADPIAVSGAFVFLEPQGAGDLNLFVLDTRTGALVDSGIPSFAATGLGHRVVITSRLDDHAAFTSVALDTAHLPSLRC